MKVMGFTDLVLVAPRCADVRAAQAERSRWRAARPTLLRRARSRRSAEALDGVTYACATAMTPRDFGPPTFAPRALFASLAASSHRVAFVFGFGALRPVERRPLHLPCLHLDPDRPDYGSLNLAQAVQLIAYDWRQALGGFEGRCAGDGARRPTLADAIVVHGLFAHLAARCDARFSRPGRAEKADVRGCTAGQSGRTDGRGSADPARHRRVASRRPLPRTLRTRGRRPHENRRGPPVFEASHHVPAPARRHRLHPRARPRRAIALGSADLLSGPARARVPPLGSLVPRARPALAGAFHVAHRALSHRHRDPSRRHHRPARLHRSRHGRGHRRDRGDRRRLHDLPGRDARRHLARQGREAPSDARPRRHRRRQFAGPRRFHGRRRRPGRLERGRGEGGAAGARRPVGNPARIIGGSRARREEAVGGEDGFLGLRPHAGRRPGVAGDEGPDRQRLRPRAPDRDALAGDRETLGAIA